MSVEDNGVGIPADPHDLFNPFVSTKPNGLGMGLPICRSIVEAHGGEFRATHNQGRPGATFQFALATADAPAMIAPDQFGDARAAE